MMPAIGETVFDILYLMFAISSGIIMLTNAKRRPLIQLFGWMTLLLGAGDSFHLIPRILNYWVERDFTAALGIGKLITSVTMTVFYLLMEYARRERYSVQAQRPALAAVWLLSAVRIALCFFPQNGWTSAEPSLLWGILRNIPFTLLGVLTVILWMRSVSGDKLLKWCPLAVALSFLFYLPVVLWSHEIPAIGMLMLPKTCMYIWMIVMFLKAEKSIDQTAKQNKKQ